MGDVETALTHAHQLREQAIESDSRGHLARSLYALGLVAQAQADPNTAEELWQQALYMAHETERRMLLWQIHASLAEVARNESLAQVHYRIAGEVIHQIVEPIENERLRQVFLTAVPIQRILAKSEED
jgi:tetratricopeptide (TPR) repeat protein